MAKTKTVQKTTCMVKTTRNQNCGSYSRFKKLDIVKQKTQEYLKLYNYQDCQIS